MTKPKKPARSTTLRKRRELEGWIRVDLNIEPGPALDALNRLTGNNPTKRKAVILKLLENATIETKEDGK